MCKQGLERTLTKDVYFYFISRLSECIWSTQCDYRKLFKVRYFFQKHNRKSLATPESAPSLPLIGLNMWHFCLADDTYCQAVICLCFVLRLRLPPVMWFWPRQTFKYSICACSVDSKHLRTFIIPKSQTDLEPVNFLLLKGSSRLQKVCWNWV